MASRSQKSLSTAKNKENNEHQDDSDDESSHSDEDETAEHSSYEDSESSSDNSDEADEDNRSAVDPKQSSQFQAFCDFVGDQDGDLPFKKGDILTISNTREDGWWEAVDASGQLGLVPSTFLRPVVTTNPHVSRETASGSVKSDSMWRQLGRAVAKPTSLDVLAALGALPPGCTESTLGPLCTESDSHYRLSHSLAPKLSASGLGLKDLFWNNTTNQIRASSYRVQRVITVLACRNIAELGIGVQVLGRHIHVCLVDGRNVLSNIHTLPVKCDPKTPKLWSVTSQTSSGSPSALGSTFFTRSSSASLKIALLLELCVQYRNVKSEEVGEISCGWAHLPLFDEAGLPVSNRTMKLNVSMGSPFENVSLDLIPASAALKGIHPLRAMILNRQKPVAVITISSPSKSMKSQLDLLSDNLVSSTGYVPFLVLYRQILADVVLCHRVPSNCAALIHSPFLTAFPSTVEQADLVDIMQMTWNEKLKADRRITKDSRAMKAAFQKMFLENVYVLWQLADLPPHQLGDESSLRIRRDMFERCLVSVKSKKSATAALLSSEQPHRPFDMSELALDLLHPNCR